MGVVFKDAASSIVTNGCAVGPGERATFVCEDSVGRGSVCNEDSLPSIHLKLISSNILCLFSRSACKTHKFNKLAIKTLHIAIASTMEPICKLQNNGTCLMQYC